MRWHELLGDRLRWRELLGNGDVASLDNVEEGVGSVALGEDGLAAGVGYLG